MLRIFCMIFFQSLVIADVYTCTLYITLLSLSASCTYCNLAKTLQVKNHTEFLYRLYSTCIEIETSFTVKITLWVVFFIFL